MQIGEGARDFASLGAGLGIEPLAEIERGDCGIEVVQIGARGGMFQETGLEERAERFGLGAAVAFEFKRIALAAPRAASKGGCGQDCPPSSFVSLEFFLVRV